MILDEQPPTQTRALIIGTGFSGLGMGIALQQQGVDYIILEKADEIGGTWRDNTYPGAACDVPAHLYSFSFEPKPDWRHLFSYQPEIFDYLKAVADKYDLRRRIVFGAKVNRAYWDDDQYRWHVFTESGQEYVAQFLISGAGALHIPSIPEIDGLSEFGGAAFHSAQWNHDVDLTGKRVAVVGTGASAIQLVPEIVGRVAELQLYQRTPAWVLPRNNFAFPTVVKQVFRFVPGARAALRAGMYWGAEGGAYALNRRPWLLKGVELVGRRYIRREISDPRVRRKLTPDYRAGCKRLLGSADYYRAIENPKTELVTESIARITGNGIVAADGTEREVDVIVFATGFHVTDSYRYINLKGRDGEDLVDRWNREGIAAHRGITVAGMPNAFFLLGPNTGLGHTSVVFMIESQIHYVAEAIKTVDAAGAAAIAPRRAAQDAFNAEVQRKLAGSVWNTGGCQSWYLDEHGYNRTIWSGFTWRYWLATRSVRRDEYELTGTRDAPALTPAAAARR
ncbi:flavin-containing monooxygenase [Mycolicibacter sinensis]|uniref:Baeyer-Villiger monooxygenase n=1 Tax=Mycolicibacter sinensis (strain JDM601) TaxID=875328 RepID=A0A1A3TK11_MYCSD|nr:NAD(P)/FAD-dependent oxidoreductase [Mycolicibacter sinensis]OBK83028.1 4-hydroxyacetophenone monooxygenase [Mycolicibacter sinensis]